MLQRYGHRSKAVSLYGCEQRVQARRYSTQDIGSVRTYGRITDVLRFADEAESVRDPICRETPRTVYCRQESVTIHRIMKHLHVSAIPSTPDHPSAIVTVIREKHMPLPREMRSMLSPIFRFQNICGMSQWSILARARTSTSLYCLKESLVRTRPCKSFDSVISIGQQELMTGKKRKDKESRREASED
jgi:hypothetical protein